MNPFLRYHADKNSAHRHTHRHTPMTTRPCGLRRAGNKFTEIEGDNIKELTGELKNSANLCYSNRIYSFAVCFRGRG